MKKNTLFHRDFTIMVVGQIISLFGNSILRFSISLYVLDLTGSAAAFGSILAISMIPTVLISPFGGILADRVNRRDIMVALDFTTAALILSFALFFLGDGNLFPVTVMMVLLSVIQAFYQPAVQSSLPVLVADEHLEQGNGVVIQVSALANLVGPILGGFLYGFFSMKTILIGSCACFFLSAVMELFLRIPFERRLRAGNIFAMVKGDFAESWHFISRQNPKILQLLGLMAMFNMVFSCLVIVGLPFLIRVYLGLSAQHNGFAEGAMAVGSILGGVLSGLLAKRMKFSRTYWLLIATAVAVIPMGFAVLTNQKPLLSYAVILISVLFCMCCGTLFSIFAQTFAQRQTPTQLLGKVASLIMVVCMCAQPIGQAIYGILYDKCKENLSLLLFGAAGISILLSLVSIRILRGMTAEAPVEEGPSEIVKNM